MVRGAIETSCLCGIRAASHGVGGEGGRCSQLPSAEAQILTTWMLGRSVPTRSACGSRPVASGAQASPCDANPMASDFAMRAMSAANAIHRGILRISGGRFGWEAMGMPMLELTTVGRMNGEARATMLSLPLQFGESVIVVASRGGDDEHPA